MKKIIIILNLIFILSFIYGEEKLYEIYEISEGIEYDLNENKLSSFKCMYNDKGLLIEFTQEIYSDDNEYYKSIYKYDNKNRLLEMENFYNNEYYSKNIINYNSENNTITLTNVSNDNVYKEIYYYNNDNLVRLEAENNGEAISNDDIGIKRENKVLQIQYIPDDSVISTIKVEYKEDNIIEINKGIYKIIYKYENRELKEKVEKDKKTYFKVIKLDSVKSSDYNFLKDFFNINKINKSAW